MFAGTSCSIHEHRPKSVRMILPIISFLGRYWCSQGLDQRAPKSNTTFPPLLGWTPPQGYASASHIEMSKFFDPLDIEGMGDFDWLSDVVRLVLFFFFSLES